MIARCTLMLFVLVATPFSHGMSLTAAPAATASSMEAAPLNGAGQAALPASHSRSRIDALTAALTPALPFPRAADDGESPANNDANVKWFVVWPSTPDESRISVKANPLHPETQKAAAAAMDDIQEAVVAAERKAQAAYDRALEQLRRNGTATDIDGISLEDEGIAGERIDAELELVIELHEPQSFVVRSGVAPVVAAGSNGATWTVTLPANTYRARRGNDLREHFRAAETILYFGAVGRPEVSRKGDEPTFGVTVPAAPQGLAVVLRGNEGLLNQVVAAADWAQLASR